MVTSGSSEGRRTGESRLNGLRILFGVCFGVLAFSFWLLQIIQNSKFDEMAANNHLRTIPLRAPRGVIFDRHGKVLVENRYSYTIALLREQTKHLDESLRTIAAVTGVDEARLRDVVQRRRREPIFRPLPLIEHATFNQVAAVTARRLELPEIVIQQVPTRAYPTDGLAAHLFGYVGEVQDSQLNSREFAQLLPGAIIGQTGLERTYNAHLMGTDGNKFVVVNSVGREIEEVLNQKQDPIDGERLQLTIDYDLQRALEDGFHAAGFAGAAAFLDPSTGEVLAMTSLPAYDPNAFAVGMDNTTWSRLTTDPQKPMTNRLIQGTYSPGSTFKILMAVAALEEGVITPETRFFCPGHATFYGRPFKCWQAGGHGSVDLRRAIEQSCNVYFYNVGDRMKIDTIHAYAEKFGLTGRTGIDLPGEIDSLVPSTAWKQRTQHQPWYPGETISVAIGQGAVSVTPISLATMIASIANGGTRVTPHLGRAYDAGDGKGFQPLVPPSPRGTFFIKPENLQAVRDGLWMVVNGAGTGGRARIVGYDVSGKTGTSQVVGLQNKSLAAKEMDVRDHGWFVFFAPRDNPQIAGVVFAEHGEHGSSAAPIAKYVMETFFAKKEGRPLPASPLAPAPPRTTTATATAAPATAPSPTAPATSAPPTPTPPAAPSAGGAG